MPKSQSRNDQRSNSKNPNNAAFRTSTTNKSNQLNPNNAEHKKDSENSKK